MNQLWAGGGPLHSAESVVLGVSLAWAAVSDTGLVRSQNEDAVLAEPGIYVVADGMGGHDAGEVASGITVERLRSVLARGAAEAGSAVPQALNEAHAAIREIAGERTIGSTVTGIALSEFGGRPTWLVWNVGDSRCYRVHGGAAAQITQDHTLVSELVAAGELAAEDIPKHPDRHVITRAIGAEESLQTDYWLMAPTAGERFLLCSDGLTNEVSQDEIGRTLSDAETPSGAVIALLSSALERGGHDNVSAVVVFCSAVTGDEAFPDETAPRASLLPPDTTVPNIAVPAAAEPAVAQPAASVRPSAGRAEEPDQSPTLISEVPL